MFDLSVKKWLNYALHRGLRKFRTRKTLPAVKRVLLIRRNKLGDMINLLPVIKSLKESHPAVEIYLLCNLYNMGPARCISDLSGIFSVPEKYLFGRAGSLLFHPVYRSIRALSIDLSIALGSHSTQAALMSVACGAKYKAGLSSDHGTLFDLAYDKAITMPANLVEHGIQHQVEKCAYIVKNAGLALTEPLPDVKMNRPACHEPGVIGICPDTSRPASRFPADSYKRLTDRLRQFPWVLEVRLFPSADTTYGELAGYRELKAIASPSFDQWLKNLARCEYAICAEGGSMHATTALGIPTVALSGINLRNSWAPWARDAVMLENPGNISAISLDEIMEQLSNFRETGAFKASAHANFCQKYR